MVRKASTDDGGASKPNLNQVKKNQVKHRCSLYGG